MTFLTAFAGQNEAFPKGASGVSKPQKTPTGLEGRGNDLPASLYRSFAAEVERLYEQLEAMREALEICNQEDFRLHGCMCKPMAPCYFHDKIVRPLLEASNPAKSPSDEA